MSLHKPTDVLEEMRSLRASGEPFAVATVVRTVSFTAAKAGAKALIRADGTMSAGWIGGGCARAAVLKAARAALALPVFPPRRTPARMPANGRSPCRFWKASRSSSSAS